MLRACLRRRSSWTAMGRWLSMENQSLSTDLKSVLEEKIPAKQEEVKQVKKQLGEEILGKVTVNMCMGGMRGIPGLVWETSLLDPEEGIRFRYVLYRL